MSQVVALFLLVQLVTVALGHQHHHLNSSYNTNFIRWKRINIHVEAHNKTIYHNRFLSSSSSHKDSNKILLSEVSTVRKCGPDGDDRFPSIDHSPNKVCPMIVTLNTPNIETCASKCVERLNCRSWNYHMEKNVCTLFSQILRSKYHQSFVSGDVDLPMTVMYDGMISNTGGFVCSCVQNPKQVYVSPKSHHHNHNHEQEVEGEKALTSTDVVIDDVPKKEVVHTNTRTCMQQMGCKAYKDTPPLGAKCNKLNQQRSGEPSSVITISQRFGSAHFHFIIESLVRLATVPKELFHHKKNLKVHIMKSTEKSVNQSSWQYELLSIFGLSKNNVVNGEVFANEVYVPSFTSCGGPSRHQVLSLRNVLLNSPRIVPNIHETVTPQSIEKGSSSSSISSSNDHNEINVILIERTVSRGLGNMMELKSNLTSLASEIGFVLKVYSDAEDATHYNQFTLLSMFSEASIIVAPHGAGLSNMIVSKPCATIIEARESSHPKCYVHLAQTLGFKYFSGCGNSGNNKEINGVNEYFCESGKIQSTTYKQGLLTVGTNGMIKVEGQGETLIEVEGGTENRNKGEKVKVKIATLRETPMTMIDIPYTIETVKNEVNWRREASSTSEEKSSNSYSHCLNNAKDYYSSFIQSTEDDHLLPLSPNTENDSSSKKHVAETTTASTSTSWDTIPNGPKYTKFVKD